MTVRLSTYLVGVFAFFVAPVVNAAIHEHEAEATVGFMVASVSGDVIVSTSSDGLIYDFLKLPPGDVVAGENILHPMPKIMQLPIGLRVSQTTMHSRWGLEGDMYGGIESRAKISIVNTSAQPIYEVVRFHGEARAEFTDPNIASSATDNEVAVSISCKSDSGQIDMAVRTYVDEFEPFVKRPSLINFFANSIRIFRVFGVFGTEPWHSLMTKYAA